MSDGEEFGDFSYGRLRKWLHSPKSLIRNSIKYTLKYFGACVIESDLSDQNIINKAVENLYAARGLKHGGKLNIKKLPKLELEINYAKIQIHTQPKTILELNQILFCEKTKVVGDDKGFQFLAFVVNANSQNTAYIFVCSKVFAIDIKQTFVQLYDMNILHTNCNEIKNSIKQIGCAPETSRHVQDLWKTRDNSFKDAVHRIQVELTKNFPLLDESLEKLKGADPENENLKEHLKLIEDMKQSLTKSLRYAQTIASDPTEVMTQQLSSYLNPQPTFKPSLSPNHKLSQLEQMSLEGKFNYDSSTLKPTSSTSPVNSDLNVYETPRQMMSPISRPELPKTPVPQTPIAFRTLPTRSPANKKSPAKSLFNTLKPKPKSNIPTINKQSPSNNNVVKTTNQTFVLEKNSNTLGTIAESTYYEGKIETTSQNVDSTYYYEGLTNQKRDPTNQKPDSTYYYEGLNNSKSNDQQDTDDPYYYCPRPGVSSKTNNNDEAGPSTTSHQSFVDEGGSQSESSTSQRNSVRESNVFEDEEPESVYITHQQFNEK